MNLTTHLAARSLATLTLPGSATRGISAVALFAAVQLADGILTLAGVARFGPAMESNPLLSLSMVTLGAGTALSMRSSWPWHWRPSYIAPARTSPSRSSPSSTSSRRSCRGRGCCPSRRLLRPRRRFVTLCRSRGYSIDNLGEAAVPDEGVCRMSGVRVLVGTRKGAFIMTADGKRDRWDVSGPHFGGWRCIT